MVLTCGTFHGVQLLPSLQQPGLQLLHALIEGRQSLVEVQDELKTTVSLLQDLHSVLDLLHLVVHGSLLLIRQHLYEGNPV